MLDAIDEVISGHVVAGNHCPNDLSLLIFQRYTGLCHHSCRLTRFDYALGNSLQGFLHQGLPGNAVAAPVVIAPRQNCSPVIRNRNKIQFQFFSNRGYVHPKRTGFFARHSLADIRIQCQDRCTFYGFLLLIFQFTPQSGDALLGIFKIYKSQAVGKLI